MTGRLIITTHFAGKAQMLALVIALLLCVLFSLRAGAQDAIASHAAGFPSVAKEFKITFPSNSAKLDRSYRFNERAFIRLDSLLAVTGEVFVDSVIVVSKASPEGSERGNKALAEGRAEAIRAYVEQTHPELADRVRMSPRHEAWDELRQMLVDDPTLSTQARERALAIIDGDQSSDAKKAALRRLPEYKYIFDNYYPALRFSAIVVMFDRLAFEVPVPDEVVIEIAEDEFVYDQIGLVERPIVIPELPSREPLFAVSTNLVYDFGGLIRPMSWTPNISVEVPIGQQWSAYAEYDFPWWLTPENDRAWEILKWDIGARWWFSRHNASDPMDVLRGHFLGIDFGAGYYDIEPQHKGYQGEFQMVGLEYGYAFRLAPAWRLDLCVGAGWMGTHYRYYEGTSDDVHLIYQHHGKLNWFGPVKAGISIKYIFNRKVRRAAR